MNGIGRWISANLGWVAIAISIMGTIVVSEISECADLICKCMIILALQRFWAGVRRQRLDVDIRRSGWLFQQICPASSQRSFSRSACLHGQFRVCGGYFMVKKFLRIFSGLRPKAYRMASRP